MAPEKTSCSQLDLDFGVQATRIKSARTRVACAHCRTGIEIPEWLQSKDLKLYFCDSRCRRAWSRARLGSGPEATVVSGHRGGNWKIQAAAARLRDDFTCRDCGVTEEDLGRRLDVHHAIPYAIFVDNIGANRLAHLVSLCPSCHRKAEFRLQAEMPLLFRSHDSVTL